MRESVASCHLEATRHPYSHLLRSKGVHTFPSPGMDRGIDMLAALLGILKAGAVYVPLDPQFPAAPGLSYMAGDAVLAALSRRPGTHPSALDAGDRACSRPALRFGCDAL